MAASNIGTSKSEITDAEFRATFSVLPHLLKLTKSLYNNADSQIIHQNSVELNAQLQKCHQLVDSTPALNLSPRDQMELLNKRKELLNDKISLLKLFKQMDILSHN